MTLRLIPVALDGGVTTLIGGGLAHQPAMNLQVPLAAMEEFPLNVGLQARSSSQLPSSTNPTLPYGVGAVPEHLAMMTIAHGQNVGLSENARAIALRIRATSMEAETLLHDMGAISILNSDSQGMGRIQETVRRTWQMAHANRERAIAAGDEEPGGRDNERILQYLAKYTINPAVTHGLSAHVGSREVGKLADIVLWDARFFGAKPDR